MEELGFNSWTTGEGVDAATDIASASAAGFRRIELCDFKIEGHLAAGGSLAGLRAAAQAAGLDVLSVNTLGDATLVEGEALDATVERCHVMCRFAAALGSPYVILGPSYRRGREIPRETITATSAAALRRLVAAAGEHGVRLGFEFHGYADCSVNTLADALAVLDRVGDPRLGLVIDSFHFYVGGSDVEELARLDPARLFIVHLTDTEHGDRARLGKPNRVFPGEGVLPLEAMVAAVRRSGYIGPYSLELLRPEYWAMDPYGVAQRGFASLRRYL